MTHLLILCEGEVERRVLKSFLRPYWQTRFQTCDVVKYTGNGALRIGFKADTQNQLIQEPDSSVLCLVDLYKEPFGLYKPNEMVVGQGFKLVQDHMCEQIESRFHSRFGAFPVVMEIETWLLADRSVQNSLDKTIPEPEAISHPTALLEQIYSTRNDQYSKIVGGTTLFGKADARRVFEDNCPHFKKLVEWIINPPGIPNPGAEILGARGKWERERDEKYNLWQDLEKKVKTDSDLDEAIKAEADYKEFLLTYSQIFRQSE